jgi:hypothetical protein
MQKQHYQSLIIKKYLSGCNYYFLTLCKHFVEIRADCEQQYQQNDLDDDARGTAGLLQRLFKLRVHFVQVPRRFVHVVADFCIYANTHQLPY